MRKLLTLGLAAILLAIPLAVSAQEAYTTRSVNVRAGPDASYPPVGALGGGAPVQVFGCLDDWSWCDVGFGYNRGWIYAPYLNYVYQGARVPFYTYAPSFGIPIVAFSLGSYWDRHYRGQSWYGRRGYWERNAPVHVRPLGPPPRATLPYSRERAESHVYRPPSNTPPYTANRGSQHSGDNRAGVPSRDQRGAQGAPTGSPPVNRPAREAQRASPAQQGGPPQEMRRASPTQQPAPAAAHDGGQRGGDKSRAEGEKGRGKEHEGNKP